MQALKDKYPFIWQEILQWGDMDQFDHINNVHYFRYLENTRANWLLNSGLLDKSEFPDFGMLIRDQGIRYRLPLTFPDTIHVGMLATEIGEDRFYLRYEIISEKLDKRVADASSTQVVMNLKSGSKCPMPDNIRQIVEQLLVAQDG